MRLIARRTVPQFEPMGSRRGGPTTGLGAHRERGSVLLGRNAAQRRAALSRSALTMTETDETLMAAAAIMGESSSPNTG